MRITLFQSKVITFLKTDNILTSKQNMKLNIHLKRFKDTKTNGKVIWGESKEAAFRSSIQPGAGRAERHRRNKTVLESQDRQCTCKVILSSVRATIVAVGNH